MNKEDFRSLVVEAAGLPENKKCFDCGDTNPLWCSCRLGIYICLNCAGRHRSYGVGISFVRSADLDRWSEDIVRLQLAGGNRKFDDYLKQKRISKPVNYQSGSLSDVLEEYRNILIQDGKESAIRKKVEQLRETQAALVVEQAPAEVQSQRGNSEPEQKVIKSEKTEDIHSQSNSVNVPTSTLQMIQQDQVVEEKPIEKQKASKEEPLFAKRDVSTEKKEMKSGRKGLGKIVKHE